ncbi:hypothetical protein MBLNU230_g7795t1 [Neophaeotheca triangularis]
MADDFVELGATALDRLTNTKGWDRTIDFITGSKHNKTGAPVSGLGTGQESKAVRKRRVELPSPERETYRPRHTHRSHYQPPQPPPPPESEYFSRKRFGVEDSVDLNSDRELERQSHNSDRVLREYENEPDDPRRVPDPRYLPYQYTAPPVIPPPPGPQHYFDHRDDYYDRNSGIMSYAGRPRSQPPRGYYSDEESDYDERTGKRYSGRSAKGRGYEDSRDGRPYDREIVEKEIYRGPPRNGPIGGGYTPYATAGAGAGGASGAMAPYRRSAADLHNNQQVSQRPRSSYDKRSKSRGRRNSRSSSRSYSRSRSRSRSKSRWREKVDDTFDTSWQGWGATAAGALVGGFAGRELGGKDRRRDMVIGALVGGVGSNVAANKWKDYREEKRDKEEAYGGRSERGNERGYERDGRGGGGLKPYDDRDRYYERRGRSTGP